MAEEKAKVFDEKEDIEENEVIKGNDDDTDDEEDLEDKERRARLKEKEERHRRKKKKRRREKEKERDARRKRKKRRRHRSESPPSRSPSYSDYSDSFDENDPYDRPFDRSYSHGGYNMYHQSNYAVPPGAQYNNDWENNSNNGEMEHDGEHHSPRHFIRGRGRGFHGRGRGRGRGGIGQLPRSKVPCKFYMDGKCSKGEHCPFSHAGAQNKKNELCKFYLNSNCVKGDQCLFLHANYPCKFFHTGAECYQGENCKFSHDPLTDETRPLLEKVLNHGREKRFDKNDLQMPYNEEFEEMPQGAQDQPRRTLLPTPGTPGGQTANTSIPSLFDIHVAPTGHQGQKILAKETQKFQFYNAEESPEVEGSVSESDSQRMMEDDQPPSQSALPVRGMTTTSPMKTPSTFYDNFYPSQPDSVGDSDNQQGPKIEDENRDSDSATSSVAAVGSDGEIRRANIQPPKVPMFLAPKQRELFMRIQQKQQEDELTTSEEQKQDEKDAAGDDDDWYSSDDEDGAMPLSLPAGASSNSQPLAAVLHTIRQQVSQSQANTAATAQANAQMNIIDQLLLSARGSGQDATQPKIDPTTRTLHADPRVQKQITEEPPPLVQTEKSEQLSTTNDGVRITELKSPTNQQQTIPLDPVTKTMPSVSDTHRLPHEDPRLHKQPKDFQNPDLQLLHWKDIEESFEVEKFKANAPKPPPTKRPSDPRRRRQSDRPADPRKAAIPQLLPLNPSTSTPSLGPQSSFDPRNSAPPPLGPQSSFDPRNSAPPPLGPQSSFDPRNSAPPPLGPQSSLDPRNSALPPLGPQSSFDPRNSAPPPLRPQSSFDPRISAPPPLGSQSSFDPRISAPPPLGSQSSFDPRNLPPPLRPQSSFDPRNSAPPPLMPQSSFDPRTLPPQLRPSFDPRNSGPPLMPTSSFDPRNSAPPLKADSSLFHTAPPPVGQSSFGPRNSTPPLRPQLSFDPRNSAPPLMSTTSFDPRQSAPPQLAQGQSPFDPRHSASPPRSHTLTGSFQGERSVDPRLARSISQDSKIATQNILVEEPNASSGVSYTPVNLTQDPRIQRSISEPSNRTGQQNTQVQPNPKAQKPGGRLSNYSIPKLPKGERKTQPPEANTRLRTDSKSQIINESQSPKNFPDIGDQSDNSQGLQTNALISHPVRAYHRLPQVSSFTQGSKIRPKSRHQQGQVLNQDPRNRNPAGNPNQQHFQDSQNKNQFDRGEGSPSQPQFPNQRNRNQFDHGGGSPGQQQFQGTQSLNPVNRRGASQSSITNQDPRKRFVAGNQQLQQNTNSPTETNDPSDPDATLKDVFKTIDPTASPFC
nr:PREDICTED: zinc finger CCCH domain-containing protein 4-like isoform X2 [Saccoglossus kowalevskii]